MPWGCVAAGLAVFVALLAALLIGAAAFWWLRARVPAAVLDIPPSTQAATREITSDEALRIVARKLDRPLSKQSHLVAENTEERDGHTYHVIHGYDDIIDDPKTGEGHTATWGWFYVDRQDGTAYKWDLAEDTLTRF
jgi:hypothetical protein